MVRLRRLKIDRARGERGNVGVIVGLLLIPLAAALHTRRRGQQQQAHALHPMDHGVENETFEPTEDVQVIVPYVVP